MKKYWNWLLILPVILTLFGCNAHDERYYREHPNALQAVIENCPDQAPKLVSCEVLRQIATQVNDYVYELRMSPQGYGKTILVLQETIAHQMHSHQLDIQTDLENNIQELKDRLAIVNWLESPAS